MQKIKNFGSILILSIVFTLSAYGSDTVCHKDFLVLDIGSSTTKGTLYTKDTCNSNITIKKRFFNQNYPYQACLSNSKSKSLSQTCINGGIKAIESIKKHFKFNCNGNCFGFATGWARYIDNQDEWLSAVENTGITTKIVSQEYEAKLKLIALKNQFNDHPFIGFDIGGGSFQLVWQGKDGQIQYYNSHYGTDNFTHDIQNKFLSKEARQCITERHNLILLMSSDANIDKISNAKNKVETICHNSDPITFNQNELNDVIAYADQKIGHSLLAHSALQKFIQEEKPIIYGDTLLIHLGLKKQLGLNKDIITLDDIYNIMLSISGMHFSEIQSKYPDLPDICVNSTQSSMLILYTMMKNLGIDQIHGIKTDYMDSFINSKIK
jgi:hypothetical protein